MKHLLLASLATTSATATGALLVITGGQVGVAYALQQGIGPATPIDGITVAVVGAGIVVGLGFLWTGAKQMIALGKYIAGFTAAVETHAATASLLADTVARLDAMDTRVAALERWRQSTDPIVTELQIRAGLRRRPGTQEAEG